MSIKSTLLLAFGVLSLMIILLLSVSLFSTYKSQDSTAHLIHEHETSRSLTEIAINAQAIRRYEKEYFIYINHEKREGYWAEWNDTKTKISRALNSLENSLPMLMQSSLSSEIRIWREALSFYSSEFTKLNDDVLAGRITTTIDANAAIQNGKNRFKELLTGVDSEIENIFQEAKIDASNAQAFSSTSLIVIAVISIIAVIVSIISMVRIPKAISSPIVQLTDLTTMISKGRANEAVEIGGSPEIVELSKSVERLRVSTIGLMDRYKDSSQKYENLRERILAAKNRQANNT